MKNIIKKFQKNENGSITAFVLGAMLFILVIVVISYFSISSKATTQNKDIDKIKNEYQRSNESEMDQAYEKLENTK